MIIDCIDIDPNKYISWESNTGEYSVRGWQYWPDRREGQYITREVLSDPKGMK